MTLQLVRSTIIGDRAFYSRENITLLTQRGYKFLMPVPSNIKWARELIEKHRGTSGGPTR